MGDVRTVEQLIDVISNDLGWRKRELSAWSSLLSRATEPNQDVYLRGAWALLYAHWEGFIKSSVTSYLEHVSRKGLRLEELSDPLAAIAMRGAIVSAGVSAQGSAHTQLVSAVRAGGLKANLPFDSATIKTNANLKFDTFAEVLLSVGCDPGPFRNIAVDLDSILLKNRNDIAHGKYLLVNVNEWEGLRSRVVQALDAVRNQLENAAVLRAYERAK